jgi:hypothetical protein
VEDGDGMQGGSSVGGERSDAWAPGVSEREELRRTASEWGITGPWARSGLGLEMTPAASSIFLYFFFWFLIYFISFAKMHQITSNQFLKFSKIQIRPFKQ